jgi:hypothetical protein
MATRPQLARMTNFYDRRLKRQLEDPEYRAAFGRSVGNIKNVDAVVDSLYEFRTRRGMSKAALARAITKNPAGLSRLFAVPDDRGSRSAVRDVVNELGTGHPAGLVQRALHYKTRGRF